MGSRINKMHRNQAVVSRSQTIQRIRRVQCGDVQEQTIGVRAIQGSLHTLLEEPDWTVRIRKSHSAYLLTLKGSRKGASAAEFEWEIERDTAESVVDDSLYPFVEKKRYLWTNTDGFVWEIDEFESNLAGLIIAEVELEDEDVTVEIPSWAGMELTYLRGWSNASLARMLTRQ